MSAEAQIERLIAAIERDLGILDTLVVRLENADRDAPWNDDEPILYLVAVALDHYYSAFEALADRITRAMEGPVERSERWHRELLEAATLAVRGVRPAIVGQPVAASLRALLEFRHFMRHAYGVPLDATRLADLSRLAGTLHPLLRNDVLGFVAALRA